MLFQFLVFVIPKELTSSIPSPAKGSSDIPLELTSSIPVGWRQPSYESDPVGIDFVFPKPCHGQL
jgi:hypothetical protein